MARERVIDELWPDLTLDRAAPRLHKAGHFARATLGTPYAVEVTGGILALFPTGELRVDAVEFERAAEEARGDPEAATAAVARYRGDLLPDDLYEPWTEEHRSRLRLRWLELLPVAGLLEELMAAEPVGATEGALLHDTAGYIHQVVVREHLVRPRLAPDAFVARTRAGRELVLAEVLADAGL